MKKNTGKLFFLMNDKFDNSEYTRTITHIALSKSVQSFLYRI